MATNIEAQARSRRPIYVLIALFFAPLLLAFLLYYGADGWRPPGSTNHGDLINPPRPLPLAVLRTSQGAEFKIETLHGKWTLVYIGAGACDARCHEALTLMRQTRLALNDDMARVQRLFLVTGDCCDHDYLNAEQVGLTTALATDAKLMDAFALDAKRVEQAGRIYIVDPLGNLMMSYDPGARPKGLLEDLKKLLKLSHIG